MSQKLARAFVSEAISNSHAGIKACWLIVFSAGTFAALSTMKDALIQLEWLRGTVPVDKQIAQYPVICFLLFAAFVLTFLRFYIGGVRVFDIRYSEIFKLVNNEISGDSERLLDFKNFVRASEAQKLLTATEADSREITDFKKLVVDSDVFRPLNVDMLQGSQSITRFRELVTNSDNNLYKFEIFILAFQTLFVVFLAFQIGDWLNFAKVYAVLLICNLIYLTLNYKLSAVVISPIFNQIFSAAENIPAISAMFPMKASASWIKNNLATLAVLLVIFGVFHFCPMKAEQSNGWGFCISMIVLVNCAVDFVLARDFYFPQFGDFLDAIAEPSESTKGAIGK
jgi:hypothetical protein